MGFGLNAISKIESVEKRPDGMVVKVKTKKMSLQPEFVREFRARARAMIAVGVVDVISTTPREIGRAISNMEVSRVDRWTDVESKTSSTITVFVNNEV